VPGPGPGQFGLATMLQMAGGDGWLQMNAGEQSVAGVVSTVVVGWTQ